MHLSLQQAFNKQGLQIPSNPPPQLLLLAVQLLQQLAQQLCHLSYKLLRELLLLKPRQITRLKLPYSPVQTLLPLLQAK
jgi:hypothetical protein